MMGEGTIIAWRQAPLPAGFVRGRRGLRLRGRGESLRLYKIQL